MLQNISSIFPTTLGMQFLALSNQFSRLPQSSRPLSVFFFLPVSRTPYLDSPRSYQGPKWGLQGPRHKAPGFWTPGLCGKHPQGSTFCNRRLQAAKHWCSRLHGENVRAPGYGLRLPTPPPPWDSVLWIPYCYLLLRDLIFAIFAIFKNREIKDPRKYFF